METIRTKPAVFYLPPTREDMREMAKKCEVKRFSTDLVEDLCNLASGGEILPPSEYRQEVARQAEKKLGVPDKDGEWKIQGGYTKSRSEAIADKTARRIKYQQNVCDFLRTVELDKFPGRSPLEQAMNLLKLLSKKEGGSGGGEDGEALPIFQDNDHSEEVGKDLNDLMDSVESLDEAEKELLKDDDSSEMKNKKDDGLSKMKIAEDMNKAKEIWLKVSRQLDSLTRMRVSRSVRVKPDPAGDEVRSRPIKHFGEMNRMAKSEWALPSVYRAFRIVTHAATVRERVSREEKKQLLYIIIDVSGSMKDGDRISKAGGVLMNRLKAVVNGEAEIYVRYFDSELYEEHFARTAKEAKDLMELFRQKNFSGRSTRISDCSKVAVKRIEEIVAEGKTTKPELVVVTDGDDTITHAKEDMKGVKLHAFVVERSNSRLTDLALETGGVGINNL
jgi:hypothetical protein